MVVVCGLATIDVVYGIVHNSQTYDIMNQTLYCTQPPRAEETKLFGPHHEGAGSPHNIRVTMKGPELWYQMALVDTTVEQSLASSADGPRDVSVLC